MKWVWKLDQEGNRDQSGNRINSKEPLRRLDWIQQLAKAICKTTQCRQLKSQSFILFSCFFLLSGIFSHSFFCVTQWHVSFIPKQNQRAQKSGRRRWHFSRRLASFTSWLCPRRFVCPRVVPGDVFVSKRSFLTSFFIFFIICSCLWVNGRPDQWPHKTAYLTYENERAPSWSSVSLWQKTLSQLLTFRRVYI